MTALINRDTRRHLKQPRTVLVLGADLSDAREEAFCRMVCDGVSVAMAYFRAGFTAKGSDLPSRLFRKPRIQARAEAILKARQTQGVITLPEVTDMLKRVFAGALHDAEYSAAHNAAFSLARLYGHVTDRAVLEVRRPSRDPDAPSELALASWVDSLPALPGPSPLRPVPEPVPSPAEPLGGPFHDASAVPTEPDPRPEPQSLNEINGLAGFEPSGALAGPEIEGEFHREINWLEGIGPRGPGPESKSLNEINGLEGPGPTGGRPENGAPARPVTGAPQAGAHSSLLGPEPPSPTPTKQKRVPPPKKQVPVKKWVKKRKLTPRIPSAKDLFG